MVTVPRRAPQTRQVRRAPGHARNVGASHASGQVLLFLDADDVLYEHHVATLLDALLDDPAAGLAKSSMRFDVPVHDEWREQVEMVSPINGAVRKALHALAGGYPDLEDAEDAVYWNVLRALSPMADARRLFAPTCRYVLHAGNHLDAQRQKFALSRAEAGARGLSPPVSGQQALRRRHAELQQLRAAAERVKALAGDELTPPPAWLRAPWRAAANLAALAGAVAAPDVQLELLRAATDEGSALGGHASPLAWQALGEALRAAGNATGAAQALAKAQALRATTT